MASDDIGITLHDRLVDVALRGRHWLLALGFLVTVGLYPLSTDLGYDRSTTSLFAPGDPRLTSYETVQDVFAGDTLCLAVVTDEELLTPAGVARLDALTTAFAAVPGVERATSVSELPLPGRLLDPRTVAEWFAQAEPDEVAELRSDLLGSDTYRDIFLGADGDAAAIVLEISTDDLASGAFADTLAQLRGIAAAHPLPTYVVGEAAMITDVYDFLEADADRLTQVSTLAVTLVVLILFRNLRWMLLPLLLVHTSLVWTRSFMVVSGVELSIIGSMTTALVTVIGIATAIHLAVRFREESAHYAGPVEVMRQTLHHIGPAILWTCLTTAAGFGALLISGVSPVRNFGLVLAFAALSVGLAAVLLLPGGVLLRVKPPWVVAAAVLAAASFAVAWLAPTPVASYAVAAGWGMAALAVVAVAADPRPHGAPGEGVLDRALIGMAHYVTRHGVQAFVGLAVVLALCGWGALSLRVETDFTKNFSEDSSIVRGYRFVEERLGGAGSIRVMLPAPNPLTPEYLGRVAALEAELAELPGVTKVLGLPDALAFARKAIPGADRLAAFMGEQRFLDFQLAGIRSQRPRELERFYSPGDDGSESWMLLQLKAREQQALTGKAELVAAIERAAREEFGQDVHVTGLYVLLTFLIETLLRDQAVTFSISAIGMVLMMTWAFRSPRLGLLGFAPNLVPMGLVLGAMGWLGLKVNVATAMIGSISLGLVVDFSIHYLARYRQERRRLGHDVALERTHGATGKAMVFANVALMLGFGVLVFSSFLPTVHFGSLVSLAMLGGLLGNLLLLPVLLTWFQPRPRRGVSESPAVAPSAT